MDIKEVNFLTSAANFSQLPEPKYPEYAFVGRSNVGKSSLINSLCSKKGLAKTSGTPGKTQLINYFIVNEQWYLVDLPGYGYAKVSQKQRSTFFQMIRTYLKNRKSLMNVFLLVDSRHEPQASDLDFMEFMGREGIAFSVVFTKIDKLGRSALNQKLKAYQDKMLEVWEELPPFFLTSSEDDRGREEILNYIEECNSYLEPDRQ